MSMLNEQQTQVVTSSDRFIFVLAGAGSGKTRVIIERIKRLLDQGTEEKNILAITFTHKASLEMKHRLGGNVSVHVHTFHQFCFVNLEEVLNTKINLITENELSLFREDELLAIANYKNGFMKGKRPYCYQKYQALLKERGLLDFDDLLLEMYQQIIHQHVTFSYQYIFIDEFQDTNYLQYILLKKMIKKSTHVFAVGDPDQSIYKFRGASSKIIETYIKEFHAKTYVLSINYRSDRLIIEAANRLIRRNIRSLKKDLLPYKNEKGLVYHCTFVDEVSEANWILKTLKNMRKNGTHFCDVAILYRNHFKAYQIKLNLYQEEIPFDENDHMIGDAIHLLSIHQAKGLEFDHVFIIGLEENVLPSLRNNQHTALEEERRLMFVALTRARHTLILTSRMRDQDSRKLIISRFVKETKMKSIRENHISDIISLGDDHGHKKPYKNVN
jgi:DNA helicase-2/ATP-dependent DNA helicase PcrA